MDGEDSKLFSAEEESVRILKGVRAAQSVRPVGHDIVKGAMVLRAGEIIQAAEVSGEGLPSSSSSCLRALPYLASNFPVWSSVYSICKPGGGGVLALCRGHNVVSAQIRHCCLEGNRLQKTRPYPSPSYPSIPLSAADWPAGYRRCGKGARHSVPDGRGHVYRRRAGGAGGTDLRRFYSRQQQV